MDVDYKIQEQIQRDASSKLDVSPGLELAMRNLLI